MKTNQANTFNVNVDSMKRIQSPSDEMTTAKYFVSKNKSEGLFVFTAK
ncbi:MAG: hypothetical protein Q8R58_00140 [Sulfuricurvum sp.]|jgi:hypothetical protein|nr:hypothetical protein [Sulfuricurvum sp.]